MKKRHIITLTIIAGLISCVRTNHIPELVPETNQAQQTDTIGDGSNTEQTPWEEVVDTALTITGQPTD